MGNQMKTVPKGRSLSFVFDRGGLTISGWVCTIEVKQFPGDTSAISRVITADGKEWPGFLTSTETAALSALGEWTITALITNATDDKEEQQVVRFHLSEAV